MARLLIHQRTRPYRITRIDADWIVWDRRDCLGTLMPGRIVGLDGLRSAWLHPSHAAAIAALDAHLREQAATEPSA